MTWRTDVCVSILILGAAAQDVALCNSTFAEANGTGIVPIKPDIILPLKENVPNASWATTLSAGIPLDNTVQSILWYNTGGVDYFDSLSLGFDVCAIHFSDGMLNNTYQRVRNDNGSCLTTLDADCIGAVQRQSEDAAMQLVNSPTYLSDGNLTANSIQCKPYYNETSYSPFGVALTTDYNSTGFFFGSPGDPCTMKPSKDSNLTFNGVIAYQRAESSKTSHVEYDSDKMNLNALLTVFMPVSDSRRQWSIEKASSVVTCLRVTDYKPESRTPPQQSDPAPVQRSGGGTILSNGQLAGVVVAAINGSAILVTIFVLWWLRRRRASRAIDQPFSPNSPIHEKISQISSVTTEVGIDGARYELPPRQIELPDVGSNDPIELEGSNAGNRHTDPPPF